MLSATCTGGIPHYPVAHAHSCYPNCPGGKDIFFIPGHLTFFFVTVMSKEYDPRRARDLAESWNGEYFCVIRRNRTF